MLNKKLNFFAKSTIVVSLLLSSTNVFAKKGDILSSTEIDKLKISYPFLNSNPDLKVVKGLDQGKFKHLEIEVNSKGNSSNILEVFIVDGIDTVFMGSAFNKSGEKISFPVDEALIKEGIAFKIGSGPTNIYMVTDPECPYCQTLEQNLADDVYKKYTINLIPLPLSFHKDAKPMFNWILAGSDQKEQGDRLHAVMAKNDQSYKSYHPNKEEIAKNEALFEKAEKAVKELKAKGTPSVYDENFKQVNFNFLLKEPIK